MKKTLITVGVATGLAFALPAQAADTKTSGGMEDKAQETQTSAGMAADAPVETSGGMAQEAQTSGGMAADTATETTGGMAADAPAATTGGMAETTGGTAQEQQAQATGGAAPAGAAQAGTMKGHRAVIGDIVDTREIQFKGVETQHRLVKIRSEEGEELVINVGDATRMPADDFEKGSKIVAVGKEARVNGEPVLFARYVGDLREAGSLGKQKQ